MKIHRDFCFPPGVAPALKPGGKQKDPYAPERIGILLAGAVSQGSQKESQRDFGSNPAGITERLRLNLRENKNTPMRQSA
jgi:hypothetical protein